MSEFFSRRTALQLGAAAGATALVLPSRVLAAPLSVRRDVSTMTANDPVLKVYAAAVTKMKGLPASDPRNWTNQAAIHQNHCPHGNWFFLPWHRSYLLYFESIIREMSGDASFTLPYWNWTKQGGIPDPFWSGALYDSNRRIRQGQSVDPTGEFCGQKVIDDILALADFQEFGSYKSTKTRGGTGGGTGELEGSPHNHVHGAIGGDMGTYMSPLDPIFWLHHCNIDRLWAMWNLNHANTSDPVWVNYSDPAYFCDASGKAQPFIVKPMRDTYSNGYRYDTQPDTARVASAAPKRQLLATVTTNKALTASDEVAGLASIHSSAALVPKLAQVMAAPAAPEQRAVLLIHELQAPADPQVYVRVFINAPTVTAATPITDPHYAGSIAFFGGGMAHSMPMTYAIDITDALKATGNANASAKDVSASLIAVAPADVPVDKTVVKAKAFQVEVIRNG